MFKLTLVSIQNGTKRYSFCVDALYIDGKAYISNDAYGMLIAKAGLTGQRISFGT